jgi:hypothetical protein
MLVQVCESMAEPHTRKREVAAPAGAMAELELKEGIVVTRGDDKQIPVDSETIKLVPAWRILLNLQDSDDG